MEYQRQELYKKSTLPLMQPETADIAFTNNLPLPREPREWEQFWDSTFCSNRQAVNMGVNASFDNIRRYRHLGILDPHSESPSRPWDLNKFSPMYSSCKGGNTSGYRSTRGSRDQVLPLSKLSIEELMLRNGQFWQFNEYSQFPNFEYEFENNSVDEDTRKPQSVFSTPHLGEPPSHSVPKPEYRKRKLTPRPSPKNPKMYKAISRVLVRAGRSLKSPEVTYLKRGSIVIVNQLKKRIARIVQPNKEGKYERVGWVSTHSGDNERMLVPWNSVSTTVE